MREVAEGKDDRDQTTTSSHAIDELTVLYFAEGKDNLDQPTTDSHATEVSIELAQINVDQGQVKTQATTSSRATDELKVLDLAEGKDNPDHATTASHATEVPMVLDCALGNVDQGQVTTASRATEGSTLLKLAKARESITKEVSSASSDKTSLCVGAHPFSRCTGLGFLQSSSSM